MTNPQRINERIRFQTTIDTPLGQTIAYLRFGDYDLKKEAEKLLISRFLPFAFALRKPVTGVDLQASTHVAYDCISQLTGIIQMIREVYQLQPVHPAAFPSPDSLSIAYQLSEAMQMMRQTYSQPKPFAQISSQFSSNAIIANGQSASAQAAPDSSEGEDEEPLEVDLERQQIDDQFTSLFGE